MFLQLIMLEWTRLSRRSLFWVTIVSCAAYTCLGLGNFYTLNRPQLLGGTQKMPGLSFDLANSLDQMLVAIPFLVILAGSLMGSDYSQRTSRQWLMRVPRSWSVLAKFAALGLLTLAIQFSTLLAGGLVGLYFKSYVFPGALVVNVNWPAALLAPLYMTLVNLPYVALALALAVLVRSSFLSVIVALSYGQVIEFMLTGLFFQSAWVKWLLINLHFSATFLLNSIGNRVAQVPGRILLPAPAIAVSAAYTLILLLAAIWFYRRQDLGS